MIELPGPSRFPGSNKKREPGAGKLHSTWLKSCPRYYQEREKRKEGEMVHDNLKIEGRTIDIRIDNARLDHVTCGKNSIGARITLMRGQDAITTHSMSNDSWIDDESSDFLEMSPGIRMAVGKLFSIVEKQIHYQLNMLGKMLPEGVENGEEDEK